MTDAARPLVFNILDQPCLGIPSGGWTHPLNRRAQITGLEYWTDLGRLADEAGFHSLFLADVLGIHNTYRDTDDVAVRWGTQFPALDPLVIAAAIVSVTRHLGLAVTASTSYGQPFDLARQLSTLDLLSNGRAGWNIVTSYLPSAAQNFGLQNQLDHDQRYEVADEFLEVCYKLWQRSWDDDAVLLNRETREYADPAKVHRIDHRGAHYSVRGPHLTPPSAQRTPVLYQAGTSSRGIRFAARHAEAIFLSGADEPLFARKRDEIREAVGETGRDPDDVKLIVGFTPVVAKTREDAQRIYDEYNRLAVEEDVIANYSGYAGIDFARFREEEILRYEETQFGQTAAKRYSADAPEPHSVRQVVDKLLTLGNNSVLMIGTAEDVATGIQDYAARTGADGFNLYPVGSHHTTESFTEGVLPLLQRRGWFEPPRAETQTLRSRLFPHHGSRLPAAHPGATTSI